jgi:hypothetical protein
MTRKKKSKSDHSPALKKVQGMIIVGLEIRMNPEVMLAQFDNEVATRCELIRTNAETVTANLQSALDLTLLGIPDCVRNMPLKVLMQNFDGDIQQAAAHFSPAAFTQLGSGPATQLWKGKREPITTPSKGSPKTKLATKHGALPNENAATRAWDSPGTRGFGSPVKTAVRQGGKSPKKG